MPIDMSLAAKAPPRKATAAKSAASRLQAVRTDTQPINQKRTDGLMGLGQLAQGLCIMVGQYADAGAIGQFFGPLAKEVANVADEYAVVAKPVDMLIEIGPFGALIAAGLPFVMQIMANHRMLDATRLGGQGVVPPEVLEAQMKTQVMKMQAEAVRQQQQAIQEAQEAQRQFEEMMTRAA